MLHIFEVTDNLVTDNVVADNLVTDNVVTDNLVTDNVVTENPVTDNVVVVGELGFLWKKSPLALLGIVLEDSLLCLLRKTMGYTCYRNNCNL